MFRQFTRFSQFQRSLALAPNILTKRLDGFVMAGLTVRRAQAVRPEHHEYVLTEMGQSLKPVVIALTTLGRHVGPSGTGSFVHDTCGAPVEQLVWCADCSKPSRRRQSARIRRDADGLVNNRFVTTFSSGKPSR